MPVRQVRIKTYLEYLQDFRGLGAPHPQQPSVFVYADTGAEVPHDDAVWRANDEHPETLRHLSDILGAYGEVLGWDTVTVGGEV